MRRVCVAEERADPGLAAQAARRQARGALTRQPEHGDRREPGERSLVHLLLDRRRAISGLLRGRGVPGPRRAGPAELHERPGHPQLHPGHDGGVLPGRPARGRLRPTTGSRRSGRAYALHRRPDVHPDETLRGPRCDCRWCGTPSKSGTASAWSTRRCSTSTTTAPDPCTSTSRSRSTGRGRRRRASRGTSHPAPHGRRRRAEPRGQACAGRRRSARTVHGRPGRGPGELLPRLRRHRLRQPPVELPRSVRDAREPGPGGDAVRRLRRVRAGRGHHDRGPDRRLRVRRADRAPPARALAGRPARRAAGHLRSSDTRLRVRRAGLLRHACRPGRPGRGRRTGLRGAVGEAPQPHRPPAPAALPRAGGPRGGPPDPAGGGPALRHPERVPQLVLRRPRPVGRVLRERRGLRHRRLPCPRSRATPWRRSGRASS